MLDQRIEQLVFHLAEFGAQPLAQLTAGSNPSTREQVSRAEFTQLAIIHMEKRKVVASSVCATLYEFAAKYYFD